MNGLAGKVHTASQSQGHGERFGGEKGVVSHEMGLRAHLRAGGAKAWEAGSAAARRYALPRNVPQKAVRAEVRKKAGGEMRPGGAWEAGSDWRLFFTTV